MIRAYYSVLKPERTYANVMTTLAGFLLACRWHIDWTLLISTVVGTTLIVASACAANNCTDRNLDARMARTKKRALVTQAIPVRNVAILTVVLGLSGFAILIAYVNWLTVLLGAIGYIDYVILYAWSKRRTPYSTLIGTISGAVPIVAGYTAVTNQFDLTALILVLILITWQMAHFYSIGIFRHKDYQAADIPVWPVVKGDTNTRNWIITYIALFILSSAALTIIGTTGILFLFGMWAIGLSWFYIAIKGLQSNELTKWARQMFGFSLVVILFTSFCISLGSSLV